MKKPASRTDIRSLISESIPTEFTRKIPVDPFAIAESEGIALVPHQDLAGFDGCLNYRADRKRFCLSYVDGGKDDPRTRYTIGHELGHYFFPHHQRFLVKGDIHGSKVYELRTTDREAEANHFSALLLAPKEEVRRRLRDVGAGVVQDLANEFQISLSAAARRMVEETPKACAAVFSRDGKVEYVVYSDDMECRSIYGVKRGTAVPGQSLTAKCKPGLAPASEMAWLAEDWFPSCPPNTREVEIWEEVVSIGKYGCITILVYEP